MGHKWTRKDRTLLFSGGEECDGPKWSSTRLFRSAVTRSRETPLFKCLFAWCVCVATNRQRERENKDVRGEGTRKLAPCFPNHQCKNVF